MAETLEPSETAAGHEDPSSVRPRRPWTPPLFEASEISETEVPITKPGVNPDGAGLS